MRADTNRRWKGVINQKALGSHWSASSLQNVDHPQTPTEPRREVVPKAVIVSTPHDKHYSGQILEVHEVLQAAKAKSGRKGYLTRSSTFHTKMVMDYDCHIVGAGSLTQLKSQGEYLVLGSVRTFLTHEHELPNPQKVTEIIDRFCLTPKPSYLSEMADRIETLQEFILEEDAEDGVRYTSRGINPDSLSYLLKFLRENPTLRRPSLNVSPDRFVSADWRESKRKLCTVYFLPDGNVRYLVFKPDANAPGGFDRHSGLTKLEVFNELRTNLSLNWMNVA